MKKWLTLLRTSLSARLSWLTVIFAAVLFLGALSFLFKQSQDTIFKEAFSRATQVLDNTAQRVEVILDKVEMSTKNVAWVVQRHLESPLNRTIILTGEGISPFIPTEKMTGTF